MNQESKDGLWLHLGFAALATVAMSLPLQIDSGWRMTALVLVYVVGAPFVAGVRGHRVWRKLWGFLLPLSVFQVLPDWYLSHVLGVLVFPEDGAPRIGTVSAYMAGLWTIPLFMIVLAGRTAEFRWGPRWGMALAGAASLLIFGLSEATSHAVLGSWYARGVTMLGDVALYVLVPELALGLLTFWAARHVVEGPLGTKVLVALMVSTFYTGALSLSYLLVEG